MKESSVALAKGDYAAAATSAEQAAQLSARAGDLSGQAEAVNQIGLTHLYRGEYEDALQSYQSAVALNERAANINGVVGCLNNIGNVYFFQGRYYDALENYQRAMTAVRSHSGQSWSGKRLALTSMNLAVLYEQVGQNQEALRHYREAQQRAAALPPDEYGQLLSNIGTLYRRLGDPSLAMANYRAARKVFANARHADAQIHVLENIGIVEALDLRSDRAAVETFTQALQLGEESRNQRQELLAHIFRAQAYYRLGDIPRAAKDLRTALDQADTLGTAEEKWIALFHLGRLDERSGNHDAALDRYRQAIAVIESLRSELRQSSLRSEFLANKRDVYDAAIDLLLSRNTIDTAKVFELVEQARERRLQDALRSKAHLTMQTVQSLLRDNDVLFEYWQGANKVALIQLTKDGAKATVRPLSASEQARIQKYVVSLQNDQSSQWREESAAIGKLLLLNTPVKKGSHVFVVPDGTLTEVPFETLRDAGGFLFERFDVNYLPAASVLRAPAVKEAQQSSRKPELLFGDPLPVQDAHAQFGDVGRTRLPYSREEVTSVAALLGARAKVFLDNADLKRTLQAELEGAPWIVHLSTHASLDLRNPDRSTVLFSPEKGSSGSQYLFLREAAALKLKNTALITISACDTERGTLTPGEGLQSFSRGFLAAGAAATVTTLWRVEDRRTAEFMKRFYLHLTKGDSKANALTRAKLDFIRSGMDLAQPRYWAAFVLNGEGRTAVAVRPSFPWFWLSLALTGLMALTVTGIFLNRRLRLKSAGRNGR